MLWVNIKRIIRTGLYSFWRNSFISLSSVVIMVITLSVIGSVIILGSILNSSLQELRDKVDVNVYFVTAAVEEDILAIKETLETLPEVRSVTYVTAEEELTNFKSRHASDQITLQALEELPSNPLGAVLNIKAENPSQYEGIAQFLDSKSQLGPGGTSIIDKVNYYQNKPAIDSLTKVINSAGTLGLVVTVILMAVSVLITVNTIRLVIYMSRDEIGVMKLVGASSGYIRGPFVVSGVLYGLLSGLITLAIFYLVTFWLGSYTENFFIGFNVFSYYTQNFGQLFFVIVGSGILIGAVSSFTAVKRYLTT